MILSEVKRHLSKKRENDGWKFIFVGADIDAFAESNNVGIRSQRAVRFSKTDDNLGDTFEATGEMMFCIAPRFQDCCVSDEAVEDVYRRVNLPYSKCNLTQAVPKFTETKIEERPVATKLEDPFDAVLKAFFEKTAF